MGQHIEIDIEHDDAASGQTSDYVLLILCHGQRANTRITCRICVRQLQISRAVNVNSALLAAHYQVLAIGAHGQRVNCVLGQLGVIKLSAVDCKERNLIRLINNAYVLGLLEHVQMSRIFEQWCARLELSQKFAIDCVHKHWALLTGTNDQTELTAHHNAHYLSYVASQYGAWTWILLGAHSRQVLVDYQRLLAIPNPNHDRGVT